MKKFEISRLTPDSPKFQTSALKIAKSQGRERVFTRLEREENDNSPKRDDAFIEFSSEMKRANQVASLMEKQKLVCCIYIEHRPNSTTVPFPKK